MRDIDDSNDRRTEPSGLEAERELDNSAAISAAVVVSHVVSDGDVLSLKLHQRVAVVADAEMRRIYDLLAQLALAELPVLVTGETGVGKELAARALHAWSATRSSGPFVALNCAALADSLVDSELFGHRRGAFTGADKDRVGFLQAANGGTLFLDEVAELPLVVQAKLLRALDARQVIPVGTTEPVDIDVRLVCATNRSLAEEVSANRFRSDLFYRLCAATVEIPPLRNRPADIRALAVSIARDICIDTGRHRLLISDAAMTALSQYRFPGNIRELVNVIRYALATASTETIERSDWPTAITARPACLRARPAARSSATPQLASGTHSFRPIADEVAELEARRMRQALRAAAGNQSRAAELLAMPRRTFTTKMNKYNLRAQ